MQVDTSCLSKMEVAKEIRFLKGSKAGGPDGLWPSFFKDGGEVLISELTNLLGSFWVRE